MAVISPSEAEPEKPDDLRRKLGLTYEAILTAARGLLQRQTGSPGAPHGS